jgi:hypothetical protein
MQAFLNGANMKAVATLQGKEIDLLHEVRALYPGAARSALYKVALLAGLMLMKRNPALYAETLARLPPDPVYKRPPMQTDLVELAEINEQPKPKTKRDKK